MELKVENRMLYIVRIDAPTECWLADGEGDPPRTLVKESARKFRTQPSAQMAIMEAKRKHPGRRRKYFIESEQ